MGIKKELRDWYIDCALAFQASEAGLSPVSRSNFRDYWETIVVIAICNWMALSVGIFLLLYNVFLD